MLLNRKDGTFAAQKTYPAGSSPLSLALADLNGDRVLDVAIASSNGGGVSVLFGAGDGTFGAATNVPSTYAIQGIAAGDFDRDGRTDLLVTNGDTTLTVMFTACAM